MRSPAVFMRTDGTTGKVYSVRPGWWGWWWCHQPERLRQAFTAAARDLSGELDVVVWGKGALSRMARRKPATPWSGDSDRCRRRCRPG